MRIAIGGFEHETNTFAPVEAAYADFEQADAWPPLSRGEALFEALAGINLPMTGFIEEAEAQGHELAPLLWCSAVPSGPVTEDAFERISAMLLEDLERHDPYDAVYLDLHGAMVSEHLEDGEGELLRRVRALVGDRPIVVSLDLHANVTEAMVGLSSALIAFRTYPHVDMAATGKRAARELARQGAPGAKTFTAFEKLPFLIPINWGCTSIEPGRSLYRRLEALEGSEVASLSFAAGFPLADIHDCGPSVMAYGVSKAAVEEAAGALLEAILAREGDYHGRIYSPDEAVVAAMAMKGPVVLADTQDNPGGGGNSDTVGLLEALVRNDAKDAVLAILYDPEAAAQAHAAGEGAVITTGLGARSGFAGERPFEGDFRVEKITDGRFTATGPMYRGSRVQIGPMALLRVESPGRSGVGIVVASRKFQAADRSIFRHVGIDPAEKQILALKSSVHFRADFESIVSEILIVEAPGPNLADNAKIPFKQLREGVRVAPLGKPFKRQKVAAES